MDVAQIDALNRHLCCLSRTYAKWKHPGNIWQRTRVQAIEAIYPSALLPVCNQQRVRSVLRQLVVQLSIGTIVVLPCFRQELPGSIAQSKFGLKLRTEPRGHHLKDDLFACLTLKLIAVRVPRRGNCPNESRGQFHLLWLDARTWDHWLSRGDFRKRPYGQNNHVGGPERRLNPKAMDAW